MIEQCQDGAVSCTRGVNLGNVKFFTPLPLAIVASYY